MSRSELACSYAALALYDDGISITAEKIAKLVASAGLCVESYWPNLFAKLAEKRDIGDLILNVGCCSSGSSVSLPYTSPATVAAVSPAAAQEKKEEAKEESDEDMGFSLFD